MTRKYVVSVADVTGFDANDTIILTGKTLIDSSITVSVSEVELRAGKGNPLIYRYFHSGKFEIALTDAQFNLNYLGSAVGSGVTTGANVWTSENVTVDGGGAGTVTGTPLATSSGNLYGWVKSASGVDERVTFTGSNFTCSTLSDTVCVTYFALDAAARTINVPASILPSTLRLVLKADLCSGDVAGSNKIGEIQIEVPKAQLSGGFSIQMKADGVANTPLAAMALADEDLTDLACSSTSIFAKITEILTSANWYDGLIGISVQGGNFGLTSGTSPKTLVCYGVKNNGDRPFIIPNTELSFTSETTGVATAGLHTGIITRIGNGTSLLTVVVDDANTIETQVTVTCS
jgi:hypothetical protein